MADPFACFGDEDEDNHQATNETDETRRLPENGLLAFHSGTERALLVHVQNNSTRNDAQSVLEGVDAFCTKRHWMMHVGPVKGNIVRNFLMECAETVGRRPLVVLELGTYCGYSSVMMADALRRSRVGTDFHVYSIEADPENVDVSRSIIEFACLGSHISVLHLDLNQDHLVSLLHKSGVPNQVDFVFIDHDKSAYLPDLQALERANFVRKGTFVAADNILFARIDDYRQHIERLSKHGVVRSKLVESVLEYSDVWATKDVKPIMVRDGIGKSGHQLFFVKVSCSLPK